MRGGDLGSVVAREADTAPPENDKATKPSSAMDSNVVPAPPPLCHQCLCQPTTVGSSFVNVLVTESAS